MQITIVAYGIAREIIGQKQKSIDCPTDATIAMIKDQLTKDYPGFEDLRHFTIAINESYQEDDYVVTSGDEVVIIPPVSGG